MARALFPCVREVLELSVAPDGDDQSAGVFTAESSNCVFLCRVAMQGEEAPSRNPEKGCQWPRTPRARPGSERQELLSVVVGSSTPEQTHNVPTHASSSTPMGGGACKRKVPGARSSAERSVVTNSFADFRCAFVVLGPSSKCHRTPRSLSYHHYQVAFCTEAPGLVSPRLQSHNVFQSKAGGAAHLPPSKAEPSGELGATFGGPSGGDNRSFCLTRARTCAFCAGGLP